MEVFQLFFRLRAQFRPNSTAMFIQIPKIRFFLVSGYDKLYFKQKKITIKIVFLGLSYLKGLSQTSVLYLSPSASEVETKLG